jgi:hypothetical protein
MALFDIFKKKQAVTPSPTALDFSTIDSNEKAIELFDKGQLVKLYLMPLDFGGQDSPMNTLFVPKFANDKKNAFDSTVIDMIESGLKLGYSVSPEYKGSSFIPSKLIIHLKGDKTMNETIDIW